MILSKDNLRNQEKTESFKKKYDIEGCEKWLNQLTSPSTLLEESYTLKVHAPVVLVQHHNIVQISSEVEYF